MLKRLMVDDEPLLCDVPLGVCAICSGDVARSRFWHGLLPGVVAGPSQTTRLVPANYWYIRDVADDEGGLLERRGLPICLDCLDLAARMVPSAMEACQEPDVDLVELIQYGLSRSFSRVDESHPYPESITRWFRGG